MEPTSYEEYVTARWAALFRTASLLTGDADAAEDLLQATLVRAYTNWSKVRRADSPDAYVRRMLLNELLDGRRKAQRHAARHHLVPAPAEDERVDVAERIDMWDRLAALPTRQRAVVVLRYYEDLSEAQIAEALGVSVGTVKSQAHAALRFLRSDISDTEGPSEVTR